MCEYCSNFDKRYEEILHCDGTPVYDSEFKPKNETVDYEIKLWLDDDDGLMIQDYFKFNNSAANYGSCAKFAIKYCPWCGRKLESFSERAKNWTEEQIKDYLGMTINKGETKE